MKLAELQALFFAALQGERPEVERAFVGTAELPAAARVGIYVDMVLWRQIDALREDFPKLNALVGETAFDAMAEAYIRRWPSEHPSLARLGRKLAEFLRACGRADLADLAALEWARAEVFEEAHVQPVETIDSADCRLELVPALRLLTLEHDVVSVWRALEQGQPAPAIERKRTHAAVWRPEWEPVHAALADEEAAALATAVAGGTLAEICAHFADAQAAFAALSSWVGEGWIARVV